jgi:tRNA modification GTPase
VRATDNRRVLPRHHDPIVAIATAPGRGAVGIVRASGRDLAPLRRALFDAELVARQAAYLPFRDASGAPIDHGLALHFPAPHSYTGEDVLELQAHGGPVVLQLLLARALEAGAPIGLRLARPGEFTERAFLNGKLDLAQAEAVADLIDASTEAAARSASRSLAGAFSTEVQALADALVELRSLVEATLDFPDEDIDFLRAADARGRLRRLRARLVDVQRRAQQGALLREGLRVVLAGQPNVGKSSLLNALAGAELAIVTPIPGTTRDKVSETIQIDGVPMHVIDTAGLRDAGDEVERIGVARSWDEIARADAVVLLHDATRRDDAERAAADDAIRARLAPRVGARTLQLEVWNKTDIAPAPAGALAVSAHTGAGLDALRRALLEHAGWQPQAEGLFMARERHLQALRRCSDALDAAAAQLDAPQAALELLAEDLRAAHDALGEITGAFSADDLLGAIFGRFCIGK